VLRLRASTARHRYVLAAVLTCLGLLAACGEGGTGDESAPDGAREEAATAAAAPSPTPTPPPPPPPPELPRGGRILFPTYRLVGFCGTPGAPALGRLEGNLDAAAAQIEALAAEYAAGRQPQPVFELIASIAHRVAGDDGMYRTRVDSEVIEEYLAAARRHRAILLLNIQPGRADFLAEVQAYERWLREPDVSVALDPEWAVEPGQVPGRVYGRTTGAELDSVAAYLSGLVAEGNLPEKPMVFHQVAPSVVRDEPLLQPKPGVVIIRSVDGIGGPGDKVKTWDRLTAEQAPHVRGGFKLFYEEDTAQGPLMTAAEVLGLLPQPEYVIFE
jgi:hypothetical protein